VNVKHETHILEYILKKKIFQYNVLYILMHTGCLYTLNKERKKERISIRRLCDAHVDHKWSSRHEVWMNLLRHKLSMTLFAQAVHDIKIWLHFLVNIFFSHMLSLIPNLRYILIIICLQRTSIELPYRWSD